MMEDGQAADNGVNALDLSMLDDFGMVESPPGIIPSVTEARTVIGQKLELRPSEADLVNRNIIPSNSQAGQGVHPSLHANMQRLHQAKVNDTLNRRIGIRPTPAEMQQRHLLPTTAHHASITEKHKQLAMGQRAQLLNGHMDTRPGPLDLMDKGILPQPVNDSLTIKREPTPNIMAGDNLSPTQSAANDPHTSPTGAVSLDGSGSAFAPKPPPLPPLLSNARPPTVAPSTPPLRRPSSYVITSPDGILQPPGYEDGVQQYGGMPGKHFSFEDVTQPQQPTAAGSEDAEQPDTMMDDTPMAQVPATPEQIQHGHIVQEQLITQVQHVEPNATRLGPFSPALNPVLEDLGEVARYKHQVNEQLQAVQARATLPHSGIRARVTAYGQQDLVNPNPKKVKAKPKKKIKKISFQQYTYPGTGDKKEKRKIKRASAKKPYAMPARPSSNRSLVLQQQAQWLQIQSMDDGIGLPGSVPGTSSLGNSPRSSHSPTESPQQQQQQILLQQQAAHRVFGGLQLPQFDELHGRANSDAMVIDRGSNEIGPSMNGGFPSVAQAAQQQQAVAAAAAALSPQPQQWSVGHQASRLIADTGRSHQRASSWGGGVIDPATFGLGDAPTRHVPEPPRALTREMKSEGGGSESSLNVVGLKEIHTNYFQTRPASFHGLPGGGPTQFGSSSAPLPQSLLKAGGLDPSANSGGYGSAPRSPLSPLAMESGPPPPGTTTATPGGRASVDGLSSMFLLSPEGDQGSKLDVDIFDISMPDVDASFLDGLNLDGLGMDS